MDWTDGIGSLTWRPQVSGEHGVLPLGNRIDVEAYGSVSESSVPRSLKDTLNLTTYFFEHDLRPAKTLNIALAKPSRDLNFLPQKISKSIPFSTNKFPEILNYFGVQAKSEEAEMLKYTLEICENPGIKGEDKYCATSLESMIGFTVSKLGKKVRVLSTEMEKEREKEEKEEYRVEEGVEKAGDRAVVCHKLNYPYAVFFCHKVHATRAYSVPLVASDGTKAKALAVCHSDTVLWSHQNLAFQALKVKPGTVPVCHFLASDTLLWVLN